MLVSLSLNEDRETSAPLQIQSSIPVSGLRPYGVDDEEAYI